MLDTSDYDRGLDDASRNTATFGDKLKSGLAKVSKSATVAFAAAETAVVAFAKKSIDAGMQFDSAMDQVSAISGAVGSDFDALREKAMEMGATTKFSATESAEAFTYMAMAGWKTEDMLDGISGIMDLAAASGENLGIVSDIVTDALTAFGLAAEDSGRFANVLAAASNNANTNVSMLGESFKYVAPVAGSLGYSVEDISVALGLMANSGIKASQAGTSLRAALSSIIDPTETVSDAIYGLGLYSSDISDDFRGITNNLGDYNTILYNSDGTTKSFMQSMQTLRSAFANLTESEQAYYATNLFGREAMSGMLAIINASESDFNKLASAINNADGTAGKMAKTMVDNLAGDITLFKSALEGAQIVISDRLTPSLREFVQFGSQGVSELAAAFQGGGLSAAMESFGSLLGEGLSVALENLPQAVSAGGQLLFALVDGFSSAVMTVIPTLRDSALEMMGGFGAYLRESLPDLMQTGLSLLSGFTASLRENAGMLVDAALELAKNIAVGLANSIPTIIEQVPIIVSNIAGVINDNGPKILAAGVQIIGTLIKGIISAIPTLVKNIPSIIVAIVDVITAFNWINLGSTIIHGFLNGITGMIGNVGVTAQTIVQNFRTVISDLPGYMKSIGIDMINGLINGIKSMASAAVDAAKSLAGSVVDGVSDFLGIHSPSRVFAGIGGNMALGLAEGWEDELSGVRNRITKGMDFGTANVDFASSGLGMSSAAIINSASGGGAGANGPISLTIPVMLPDGTVLAKAMLSDLIKTASAAGTPITQTGYA